MNPTRRTILKAAGALTVAFSIRTHANTPAPLTAADVDGLLQIGSNDHINLFIGKVDLGTGIATAFAQIAAEELDIPVERVKIVEGDTQLCPDQGETVGSRSMQFNGIEVRLAAATARDHLAGLAADLFGVAKNNLNFDNGMITAPDGRSVGFQALLSGRRFGLRSNAKVEVKRPENYKIVGKPVHRIDLADKVLGRFTYVQDIKVPGMLHGRVIRPPSLGAELIDVDASPVKNLPNVRIVRKRRFLGVVADHEWVAIKAAETLRAKWTEWNGLPGHEGIFESMRKAIPIGVEKAKSVGDPGAVLAKSAKTLSATYEFPAQTHGSIGPSCSVADVRSNSVVVWSATQGPHVLQEQLSEMLGLERASVRVIFMPGAGCYGRNGAEDAAADAVVLSREIGRPVRVQWSRRDEHGWDPKGPPCLIDLTGCVGDDGQITAWKSEFWLPLRVTGPVPVLAGTMAGLPQNEAAIETGGIQGNAVPSYAIPNLNVTYNRINLPFRTAPIRSPGKVPNNFANESFLDELAHEASIDPVEFRLRHMKDRRAIDVIERAADASGWRVKPKVSEINGEQIGRGFSYINQSDGRGAHVAGATTVHVSKKTGLIRVVDVTVAHDCGLIINSDGLRNQIEGSIIQTLSRTLSEEATFDQGFFTALDWDSYRILTFPEAPAIRIELIDRPDKPALGAGEPTCGIVPSMIGNAIFDAVGVRLRKVPFTSQRMLAALSAQQSK